MSPCRFSSARTNSDASSIESGLGDSAEEKTGSLIVKKAVVEPLRWIAENGGEPGYVIVSKVAEMEPGFGYNGRTGEYVNLLEAGVIDPVKVTRSALANAASIASLLLTTETLVVDKPELVLRFVVATHCRACSSPRDTVFSAPSTSFA